MDKLSLEEIHIINRHGFAQILSSQTSDNGFAALSYCPLQLIDNNQLLGHLSKHNPLINAVKENPLVKVIFTGPQGYISPRWHDEQVVPTWNYATVELVCRLSLIESSPEKFKAMASISQHFDPQWDFNNFAQIERQGKHQKMVQQMLSAITVFELTIVEVNSKFKLSQNRSIACRSAFQENLQQLGNNDLAEIQLL